VKALPERLMAKIGDRVFVPASSWPEYPAPADIGGWAGSVTQLGSNRRTIKFKVDDDDEEYDLTSRHVLRAQRVIQGTPPITPPPFEIFDSNTGLGVRTTKAMIKQFTCVGVYPGRVYTNKQHKDLHALGIVNAVYSVDMFSLTGNGRIREGHLVIDPSMGHGIDPMFAHELTPRINEPPPGKKANCSWVYNTFVEGGRIEIWTDSHLAKKGEELTLCYGKSYPRTWETRCCHKENGRYYIETREDARRGPRVGRRGQ